MSDRLPAAFTGHVPGDAADIVAEVRRRVVSRVTAELVDAYAGELLRQLQATGDDAPAQARPASTADEAKRRGCYVYAVVEGDGTGAVTAQRGVQDAEVMLLRVGDLCALMSDVDLDALSRLATEEADVDDSSALAVAARAHDAVVDAAFRAGSVIPLRFGTVVADSSAVADLVQAHADELRAELRRVCRAAEWTVKIALDPAAVPEPVPEAVVAEADNGRDYLSSLGRVRQARADLRRRVDDTVASAHRSLCELSLDSVRGHGAGERPPVLNATYLVHRDDDGRFARRCEELHASLRPEGLTLELSGPWPAYHFVDVRLGEGLS